MSTAQRPSTPSSDDPARDAAAIGLLRELQELAAEAPLRGREAIRAWLSRLGSENDHETLGVIVARGSTPDGPRGRTEGEMLGRLGGPLQVRLAGRAQGIGASLGMGWTGKTFEGPSTGYNRLTRRSKLAMQVLSLGYRCQPLNDREVLAFRFRHQLESSAFVDGLRVRSVVYDEPAFGNPPVLHHTRDEVVQLAPGAYLGQALLRSGERWNRIGFFTAFTAPPETA